MTYFKSIAWNKQSNALTFCRVLFLFLARSDKILAQRKTCLENEYPMARISKNACSIEFLRCAIEK
ncbi:MAG: hypothetical protein B6D41_19835 [Chloroflexi bacterium UTCFX4]|nr:MAG: hypothetical protein B6D41_19835 [Chloroflexi bacterium UTCFX4]